MHLNTSWNVPLSVRWFFAQATNRANNSLAREGWQIQDDHHSYTQDEVDSIHSQVIAKIPAEATKVIDLGCGCGEFYQALKAARPDVTYIGLDLIPDNIDEAQRAKGEVVVAGVLPGDTVTVGSVTLTAASSQSSGALDFSVEGNDKKVAASLVAAINDSGNGLNGVVEASVDRGSTVVVIRAASLGEAGNATAYSSSDATRLKTAGANLEGGVDAGVFTIGNLWEYLNEAAMDWDFLVSINTAFTFTNPNFTDALFDLINAKSPKGFFILGSKDQATEAFLANKMAAALSESVNVTSSYYTGPRDFLEDNLVKELTPFYIVRESTPAVAPEIPLRTKAVTSGLYQKALGREYGKLFAARGEAIPTDCPGVVTSGGLITGTTTVPLQSDWVYEIQPSLMDS